jgi:hypothetical protein
MKIICCFICFVFVFNAFGSTDQNLTDVVLIENNAIDVPLGRFILYRSDNQYAAIKFTKTWIKEVGWYLKFMAGKDAHDEFSEYDIYSQFGTLASTFNHATYAHRTVSLKVPRGFGRASFQFGNPYIKYGQINLLWSGGPTVKYGMVNFVCFGPDSWDTTYKHELAPTPWTKIEEVNFNDPRLKWYKYDENRKEIIIPINKLWVDTSAKKEANKNSRH